jgi:hypothetical protein
VGVTAGSREVPGRKPVTRDNYEYNNNNNNNNNINNNSVIEPYITHVAIPNSYDLHSTTT